MSHFADFNVHSTMKKDTNDIKSMREREKERDNWRTWEYNAETTTKRLKMEE